MKSVFTEVNPDILTALYAPETDRYLSLHYFVGSVMTQGDPITSKNSYLQANPDEAV